MTSPNHVIENPAPLVRAVIRPFRVLARSLGATCGTGGCGGGGPPRLPAGTF